MAKLKKNTKRGKLLLTCTVCGTDLPVPLCCEKQMKVEDGTFICTLCGTEKKIPLCCGDNVKIVSPRKGNTQKNLSDLYQQEYE